jgi:ribosomal protein S18 acetylase RimI-like enzyme
MHVLVADFDDPAHARAIVDLTDAYARDPLGGGKPLGADVRARLVAGLRATPGCFVLLAFDGDAAVGIATCMTGFSTFAARPLVNVHDLAVLPSHRGRGVGLALLDAVAERARRQGCRKVTLEVLENNPARRLYERAGFRTPVYGEGFGAALFLERVLD